MHNKWALTHVNLYHVREVNWRNILHYLACTQARRENIYMVMPCQGEFAARRFHRVMFCLGLTLSAPIEDEKVEDVNNRRPRFPEVTCLWR